MLEEEYVYLDVRTEAEVGLGHPEGAYNVPFMLQTPKGLRENPDFVAVVSRALGRDAKLLVGCQVGNRSRAAVEKLREAGLTEVVEQRAGYEGVRDAFGRMIELGWRAVGLPCATELLPGRDYAALVRRR